MKKVTIKIEDENGEYNEYYFPAVYKTSLITELQDIEWNGPYGPAMICRIPSDDPYLKTDVVVRLEDVRPYSVEGG